MPNENWPAQNIAEATIKSMRAHKRKPADVYPTPYEAPVALFLAAPPPKGATILEPACGNGAISRVLEALGCEVESRDLRHTGYGEGGCDFLNSVSPAQAIITNPPFNLAADFIRKACSLSPYVAMLLKSNYWHTAGRLALYESNPPTYILPITWRLAFLAEERGTSPLMDCTWFVWDRTAAEVRHAPLRRPTKPTMPAVAPRPLTTYLADLGEALDGLGEAYRGR